MNVLRSPRAALVHRSHCSPPAPSTYSTLRSVSDDVEAHLKATNNGQYYPSFSIGIKIDPKSPGAIAIASLRAPSPRHGSKPFERLRLFKQFPIHRAEACTISISRVAKNWSALSLVLQEPYGRSNNLREYNGRYSIRLKLKGVKAMGMYSELRGELQDTIAEMRRPQLDDFTHRLRQSTWGVDKGWDGSITVAVLHDPVSAVACHTQLTEFCKQKLKINLLGLHLCREEGKALESKEFERLYMEFPFARTS